MRRLHLALEVEVDRLGRAQLVAQRAPHLLEREGEPADLVGLARRWHRAGQLAARHLVGALLERAHRVDHVAHDQQHQPQRQRQRQPDRRQHDPERVARRQREQQHQAPTVNTVTLEKKNTSFVRSVIGARTSSTGRRWRAPSWASSGRSTSRSSSVS